MFSRIPLVGKAIDFSKQSEVSIKKPIFDESAKSNEINDNIFSFDLNKFGYLTEFVPPPPRMNGNFTDIVSDGLTTCDLCSWASLYNDKSFFSLEGYKDSTKDLSWLIVLMSVSFCSAFFGAIVMVLTLRYRRNGSVGGFMFEKQTTSTSINTFQSKGKQDMKRNEKSSNMDIAFFMEQDEDLYATLDDHDSLSSENMNSLNKTAYIRNDETDMPLFSSAPSSAYYSDLSNHIEKPYENIESFNMERTDSTFITLNQNRLSAISENNFESRNNCNSEYV